MIEQLAVESEPASLFQDTARLTYRTGQSKSLRNSHRIRPHQYGRSDFQQLGCLLKDFRLETELPERQRGGQAANAATDNSDSHQVSSFLIQFSVVVQFG